MVACSCSLSTSDTAWSHWFWSSSAQKCASASPNRKIHSWEKCQIFEPLTKCKMWAATQRFWNQANTTHWSNIQLGRVSFGNAYEHTQVWRHRDDLLLYSLTTSPQPFPHIRLIWLWSCVAASVQTQSLCGDPTTQIDYTQLCPKPF